jgi:hypothetical protein
MLCLVQDAERQQANAVTSSLFLTVVDDRGNVVQSNLFILLEPEATGEQRRTLHWHAPSRSFRYAALPPGRLRYRIWTSPERMTSGTLTLAPGEQRLTLVLPPAAQRRRLEFPIRERLANWRSRLEDAIEDPARSSPLSESLASGTAGALLLSLIHDGSVVASFTRPLDELGVDAPMWRFIDAHMQNGQARSAMRYRARFAVVAFNVARNTEVRRVLAPAASDEELWTALLEVLATLDDPDLDDLFIWCAHLHHPATALFDQFARSWADRFNGLNNIRTPVANRKDLSGMGPIPRPQCPALPAPVLEPALRKVCAPALADIAHIVQALRGQP